MAARAAAEKKTTVADARQQAVVKAVGSKSEAETSGVVKYACTDSDCDA